MQFFKVEGLIADENWAEKCDDRRSLREKVRKIAMQSNAFNQKQKKNQLPCIVVQPLANYFIFFP